MIEARNSGLKFRLLCLLAAVTRRFPVRGSARLVRLLHNPDRRTGDHIALVVPYDSGLRIQVDTASFIEWWVFFFGNFEAEIARLLPSLIGPGSVVVDIGANIGCHALVMASCVGPSGRVLAFEPHPGIRARLQGNLELNGLANVTVSPLALSNTAGRAILHAFVEGTSNQGMSTLADRSGEWAGESLAEEIPVEVSTLDEVMAVEGLGRLDLMKVDTEGFEARTLRGGWACIRRFRPYLIFEYNERMWRVCGDEFGPLRQELEGMGYSLFVIGRRSLGPVGGDVPAAANILAVPAGANCPAPLTTDAH